MKALVFKNIGEYPELQEVEKPDPQEFALVNIKSAALNHRDVWIAKGMYPGIVTPSILGSDGMGVYEGRKVVINPGMNWGDSKAVQGDDFSILGSPMDGTLAEYVKVSKENIYDAPKHMSNEEAAALPLAGLTAYRALVVKCRPRNGEKVLISGIGGGVALFAMQFAIAIGCEVYVTSSKQDKIDKAISLGAKGGVLYSNENWHKELKAASGGIDVVIDGAGGSGFAKFPGICNPGGRIAFYGGTRGKIDGISPQIIFWKQLSIFGSTMGSDKDFVDMLDFVNRHEIKPVIDSVYPMKNGHKAFEKMDKGQQFGKLVINI